MTESIYRAVADAIDAGVQTVTLVTVIAVKGSAPGTLGGKMLVFPDGTVQGTIGGGGVEHSVILSVLAEPPLEPVRRAFRLLPESHESGVEATSSICGGVMEVFIEPVVSPHHLIIIGGGHCAKPLATLGSMTGFRVSVFDNRLEWATQAHHPTAALVKCLEYEDLVGSLPSGKNVYVVIMTHGHTHDRQALEQCLSLDLKYLGMIGSRRKVASILEQLRVQGHSERALERVFSPIGFAIGSRTPAEVAVSICAQLIAVRQGKDAVRFSDNPFLVRSAFDGS